MATRPSRSSSAQARTQPRQQSVVASVSIERGTCYVFSSNGMEACPLCRQKVPPNVHHECEKNGGVTVVRNRP
jgi:hypothetical protein